MDSKATKLSSTFPLLIMLCCGALSPEKVAAQTFSDVPPDYWAFEFIEELLQSGITSGCGGGNYCPENHVTRAQMAVFLERVIHGASYQPTPASGNLFLDVGANDFAAAYIEQLFNEGITGGCGGNNYCPTQAITRSQMAVFLLRAKHGSGYLPPPATGIFNDVDLSYWAVGWIEQLKAEGITTGCTAENYCPEQNVTRAQMAAFLVRAFGLDEVPPMPPTNPVISNITSSSATLSWTDTSDNESGFQIGTCAGLILLGTPLECLTGFTQIDQAGANVTSYTFIGLSPNTEYSWFVRAYNTAGISANTGVSITTALGPQTVTLGAINSNVVQRNSLDSTIANKAFPNSFPSVGTNWGCNLAGATSVSLAGLVKYDISSLHGRTIDSATLNLEVNVAPVGFLPQDFHVGTVATPWSPATATWNSMATFLFYNAGWQFNIPYPVLAGQTYSIDLTSVVQNWADKFFDNNGLGFISADYNAWPGVCTSLDAYEFFVPTLTVNYH
jgi:hypothetical protein